MKNVAGLARRAGVKGSLKAGTAGAKAAAQRKSRARAGVAMAMAVLKEKLRSRVRGIRKSRRRPGTATITEAAGPPLRSDRTAQKTAVKEAG